MESQLASGFGSECKPASDAFKEEVKGLMKGPRGKLYAKFPHPDFADWPAGHDPADRIKIMEPHVKEYSGTALEIGCYVGAFSHWLESLAFEVTAVEKSPEFASVGRQLRDLCGKKFTLIEGRFNDIKEPKFDVVLALSVFHHALKKQKLFEDLEAFLKRLDCRMMIFEPHNAEKQPMGTPYRQMHEDEFVAFVAERTGLTKIEQIGSDHGRKLFKMERP